LPAESPATASQRRRFSWRRMIAAALCLGGLGLFAVYYLMTDSGTLVVEVHDLEQVDAILKRDALRVEHKSTGRNYPIDAQIELRVPTGDYLLVHLPGLIVTVNDDLVTQGIGDFKLIRGAQVHVVVKVDPIRIGEWTPAEAIEVAKGSPLDALDPLAIP